MHLTLLHLQLSRTLVQGIQLLRLAYNQAGRVCRAEDAGFCWLGSEHYELSLQRERAEFCCNGTVVEDSELGHVIQLQGDQRKNVSTFLTSNNIAKKDLIKVHGELSLARPA